MPTYQLVNKDKLDRILDALQALIAQSPTLVQGGEPGLHPAKKERKKRGGIKLADVIYNSITLSKFTPQQVYETIKDSFNFKGDRYLDSIRTAMKSDGRFRQLPDKSYEKVR